MTPPTRLTTHLKRYMAHTHDWPRRDDTNLRYCCLSTHNHLNVAGEILPLPLVVVEVDVLHVGRHVPVRGPHPLEPQLQHGLKPPFAGVQLLRRVCLSMVGGVHGWAVEGSTARSGCMYEQQHHSLTLLFAESRFSRGQTNTHADSSQGRPDRTGERESVFQAGSRGSVSSCINYTTT